MESKPSEPQPDETITLSDREWEAFAAAIENPPEPNEALKKLMRQAPPRKKKAAKKGQG
jgi:uncharacterized protein (DUF1778 family)